MKYETIERNGKKTGRQKIIFVCSPYRPLSENAVVAAEEGTVFYI